MRAFIGSVLMCCATAGTTHAQAGPDLMHSVRFGVNIATFLENSVSGIGSYAEYGYSFNDHLALVPRVMGASGQARFGNGFYHSTSFATSVSIRLTPAPASFSRLKFDIGPMYHRLSLASKSSTDRSGQQIEPGPMRVRKDLFGAFASLSVSILGSDRMDSGARIESMMSIRPAGLVTDLVQGGIYLGIRF